MDIFAFFRRTTLTFVQKSSEGGDIVTFQFTPKKPLRHIAGQHGVFILPRFGGIHIFSLSSAPEEQYVAISTHVRKESKYKQRLNALQPGDKITVFGPVLNFFLKDNVNKYVFLAQGIGITPFRSMLVHAREKALPIKTTLIHVDANGHVFKELTQQLATDAHYVSNPDEFTQAIKETINTDAHYYISGSGRFTKTTKATLASLGVKRSQVRIDTFLGY